MKILVMGSGAVGGYFGGVLSWRGEDVTFVARGPHLEAIDRHGLRVECAAAGNFTVRPRAVERPDGRWTADLVLFCVKSYHNAHAIETVSPAVGDATSILTLQNGIGAGDELASAFGRERVLLGAAYIDAMRKGPGVVAQTASVCRIVFGEEDGTESPRALEVRSVFQRAGIDIQLSSDILKELWNKLIFICALSGMTCVTRGSFAEVLAMPECRELTRRVLEEGARVGRAKSVKLDPDIVESTMAHFQALGSEMVSSMFLDLEAGRPLELGGLNGAIARLGKETGVPTPVNDFITACLAVADSRARSRMGIASPR